MQDRPLVDAAHKRRMTTYLSGGPFWPTYRLAYEARTKCGVLCSNLPRINRRATPAKAGPFLRPGRIGAT